MTDNEKDLTTQDEQTQLKQTLFDLIDESELKLIIEAFALRKQSNILIAELSKTVTELNEKIKQQDEIIKDLQKQNIIQNVQIDELEKNQDNLADEIRYINDREQTALRLKKVY